MKALITGGLGFVGHHLADALRLRGWEISVLDDCSRPGSHGNARTLKEAGCEIAVGDVSDLAAVATWMSAGRPDVVFHLAAQVAVTRSVANPRRDSKVNVLGTLNVLETARRVCPTAPIIYASTNKVYGETPGYFSVSSPWNGRYQFVANPCWPGFEQENGVPEKAPLDFASPYGCSKGAADQYVLDYARTFGMRTACLRKSCVYGPGQYGCEDQGWLAWFAIREAFGLPITVYGDGCQVRDVLYIDDCVGAYLETAKYLLTSDARTALVLNVGGGPANTLAVNEALAMLPELTGRKLPSVTYEGRRPGDQLVYVSDVRRARRVLGWAPTTPVREGVKRLLDWVREEREEIGRTLNLKAGEAR